MNIQEKIGNRIRELRQQKRLSQEALANIAEVDRTYMTSVENGRRNISVVTLEKILIALGISFTKFFDSELFTK
jgi:transcriptional regulator with XRE-family HTH domain